VIIEGTKKADANLGQIFEVGIGHIASCAVVFDEILIVLVIGWGEP
jgi:hypothetical protein